MVKVILVSICVLILFGTLMFVFSGCRKSAATAILFGSDCHIDAGDESSRQIFQDVIAHAYKTQPQLDAVALAGDLANNGTIEDYAAFKSIKEASVKKNTDFTACMGNHEWYMYGWGVDVLKNPGMKEEMQSMFEAYTECAIESDIKVNGIHIIAVSPDNEMDVYRTREAYARHQIQEAAREDPNKPIFLIAHKNVDHTVISTFSVGSDSTESMAPDWSDEFKEFLAQYPQLIYISGHTHNSLKDARSIYQTAYTHVNDGCMRSGEYIIANISKDNVVTLHRMDAVNDEEIGSPWVIDIKAVKESREQLTYGESRYEKSAVLNFEEDARLSVREVTATEVTLEWPEASGKDEVECDYAESYILSVTNKATGERIDPNGVTDEWYEGYIRIWFDAYYGIFNSRQITVSGLEPNTAYIAEIFAVNPLDKPGNTIRTEFTTSAA